MSRKQLNITLSPEQYAAVQAAAAEEGVKVAVYCRDAILAQAMPQPDLPDSGPRSQLGFCISCSS